VHEYVKRGLMKQRHPLRVEHYTDRARRSVGSEGISAAVARLRMPSDSAQVGPIPLTQDLTRSLQYAVREAVQLGCNYIGTEHLLLGLVTDCGNRADSTVTAVLAECSVKPLDVREAVMQLLRG
jgi:ATP-dependent Clp protease ATP-binding subunit ClpC